MNMISKHKVSDCITAHTNNTTFLVIVTFLDKTKKAAEPRTTTRTTKENPIVKTEFILNI